jgi:hypothetical protein
MQLGYAVSQNFAGCLRNITTDQLSWHVLSDCGNFRGVIVTDYHCVTLLSRSHVNLRETSLN